MSENPELVLKKWEALYALTKDEVSKLEDRFDKVEEKAARQFTILSVLLGVIALSAKEFIKILTWQSTFLGNFFVIVYVVLAFSVIATMVMHLFTLKYNTLRHLGINTELIKRIEGMNYVTVLYRLSEENTSIAKTNLEILQKKVQYGEKAYHLTKLVIGAAVLCAILYVVLRLLYPAIWQS